MEVQPAEVSEIIPPGAPIVRIRFAPDWIPVLRVALAGLYRLMVAGGSLYLVMLGGSPWLILAAVPLMLLGPRSR